MRERTKMCCRYKNNFTHCSAGSGDVCGDCSQYGSQCQRVLNLKAGARAKVNLMFDFD